MTKFNIILSLQVNFGHKQKHLLIFFSFFYYYWHTYLYGSRKNVIRGLFNKVNGYLHIHAHTNMSIQNTHRRNISGSRQSTSSSLSDVFTYVLLVLQSNYNPHCTLLTSANRTLFKEKNPKKQKTHIISKHFKFREDLYKKIQLMNFHLMSSTYFLQLDSNNLSFFFCFFFLQYLGVIWITVL